jgi:hypothetical protein
MEAVVAQTPAMAELPVVAMEVLAELQLLLDKATMAAETETTKWVHILLEEVAVPEHLVKMVRGQARLAMVALGLIIQSMERMPIIRVVEAEVCIRYQEP